MMIDGVPRAGSGVADALSFEAVQREVLAALPVWERGGTASRIGGRTRAHYDRRKADGDRHATAQRNLFGRLLGCLHHCLATGRHYDENTAFPRPTPATRDIAA